MAKGDLTLVPVVLQTTDPDELAKLVVTERIKRNQMSAKANYTATYIPRTNGTGFTRYTAFVEFLVEEK